MIEIKLPPSAARQSAFKLIRWGLYPVVVVWVAACLIYGINNPELLQPTQMIKGGVMMSVLFFCEWYVPYETRWGMTGEYLLKRDLVFVLVNGVTFGVISTGITMVGIYVSGFSDGPMAGQSLLLQVVTGLLVFEALQYTTHRMMHESRGPLTNFLWRTHAIHHLPKQLYLVMHVVFHPFNAVIVRLLVQLTPIWLLGYDPVAVFVMGSLIALQGTISHFNVDIRLGWLNYLVVGPELHRYHHSANSNEAVNYGVALPVYDLIFGTFEYKPGVAPAHLGLDAGDGYPAQVAPLESLLFPFRRGPVTALQPIGPVS